MSAEGLDSILGRAREVVREAAEKSRSTPPLNGDYDQVIERLREVSTQAAAATLEQTLLFAYARTHLVPPPSFHALAEASGMSYSGVRARLTPEVMQAVRGAGKPDRNDAE